MALNLCLLCVAKLPQFHSNNPVPFNLKKWIKTGLLLNQLPRVSTAAYPTEGNHTIVEICEVVRCCAATL
jgi:hypothetical protein